MYFKRTTFGKNIFYTLIYIFFSMWGSSRTERATQNTPVMVIQEFFKLKGFKLVTLKLKFSGVVLTL